MGHQADHVAFAIADSGDGPERTVWIGLAIVFSGIVPVGRDVAKNNLVVAFEFGEYGWIAKVVAVIMRNRTFQNLSALRCAGEGCVRRFHTDMNLAAKIPEAPIAHHRAGQKTGFEENLKTVADAQNQAAGTREPVDRFHNWRKPRNRTRSKIIAECKASRKNNRVEAGNFFGLVPDEFNRLADDQADCVVGVVVAIRAGELNDPKFHRAKSPRLDSSTRGIPWMGDRGETGFAPPRRGLFCRTHGLQEYVRPAQHPESGKSALIFRVERYCRST